MELAVGKVVGKSGQGRWGQVHDFNPEDGVKRISRGRLIAAVSLKVPEAEEQVKAVAFGREALSRLQEMYYGETELTAMEQLKKAVVGMAKEFEGIEIASAAIMGETVYIATAGGAGAWVSVTQAKQGWLVRPDPSAEMTSFSGKAVAGEVIVLGTHGFWAYVTERLLVTAAAKTETNFQEAVEIIVSEVQSGEGESGGAGTVIKVSERQQEIARVPEEGDVVKEAVVIKTGDEGKSKAWTGLMKKIAGKIYIQKGDKKEQRRKTMIAGVGFLALVILFFGIGHIRNIKNQQTNSVQAQIVEKIKYDFEEAKAMAALNPARSRELLGEIKQSLDQLPPEADKETAVSEIRSQWQGVWDEAAGIVKINPEELLDLGLVRDGMTGDKMVKADDELLVLDSKSGRVGEINSKTAAGKIVAGGDGLSGASQIAVYPGKIMVLKGGTVWEVTGGKTQARVEDSDVLSEARDIQMWAGNIYVLTAGGSGGMIWRYQTAGDGFGAAREWLADGPASDLSGATVMSIDGSIWIAAGGQVYEYSQGVKDDFAVTGSDQVPGSIDGLYTDENSENLYLWDKNGARLVAINKNGEYIKQYTSELLGRANDMVVDEAGGAGYILADGKIWKMTL